MLKEINISELSFNPFTKIGSEWMLITAGNREKYNTMTASWGSLGVMWGRNVSNIVIRPQRYTLEFVEREDYYSLSFFGKEHRDALNYCGSHSGRDVDKEKETGLTPVFDAEAPYFQQANLVLICRKLHSQLLDPARFIDKSIDAKWYPEQDYHKLFVGEIVRVFSLL